MLKGKGSKLSDAVKISMGGAGLSKKERAAVERYGIDMNSYGYGRPGGGGIQKKDPKQFQADLAAAANNDYDTRRSIEAAAMAGNKKAQKYAAEGLNSLDDITDANNRMRKFHKKNNGGSFSSQSDYSGLTYDLVQRDRNKLVEGLTPVAAPTVDDDRPTPAPEPRFNIDAETAKAEDDARDLRIDEYEKNRATGGFFGNEAANSYLDDYKLNVRSGLQNAGVPTRGPLAPTFIL